MTSTVLTLILALAALAVVAWLLRPGQLGRAVDRAMKTRDLEPLAEIVRKKRGEERATAFNHAVRRLWDGYERELAAHFVTLMAPELSDVRIVQYWMKQILEVEPELARQRFADTFLEQFYRPDVAQKCGAFG